jgi:hypothetical protein
MEENMKKLVGLFVIAILMAMVLGCSMGAVGGGNGGFNKSGLTMKWGTSTTLSKSMVSKAITSGQIDPTTDTFAFAVDVNPQHPRLWLNNSGNTSPGSAIPFSIYNSALGAGVGDGTPSSGSSSVNVMVNIGGSTSTSLGTTSFSTPSGTYDEAILLIASGWAKPASTFFDLGPHFNIVGSTTSMYGFTGQPDEGVLQFGTSSADNHSYPTVILFLPTSSGISQSTGLINLMTVDFGSGPGQYLLADNIQADIDAALATFLSNVHAVLPATADGTHDAYWTGFFQRYCEGFDNGKVQLGGQLSNMITISIIPMTQSLNFGNGGGVTMNIAFDPTKATYDDKSSPGTLKVTGTPPLNFSLTVQ